MMYDDVTICYYIIKYAYNMHYIIANQSIFTSVIVSWQLQL